MRDSDFARDIREENEEPLLIGGDAPVATWVQAVVAVLCILGAAIFLGLVACIAGVEWVRR